MSNKKNFLRAKGGNIVVQISTVTCMSMKDLFYGNLRFIEFLLFLYGQICFVFSCSLFDSSVHESNLRKKKADFA